MSAHASAIVISEIKKKRNALLCAATGNSPTGLYANLASEAESNSSLFADLKILKLDEWGGVPYNHSVTCEYYLRNNLIDPLKISSDRYISFASNPADPLKECKRVEEEIIARGSIDICVLGLGKNGHLGFNEPSHTLEPFCHIAQLSEQSLQHDMVSSLAEKPKYGLTLGLRNILSSKKIILLIAGSDKGSVIEELLTKRISTNLPASMLWLHQNVECLIDQKAL